MTSTPITTLLDRQLAIAAATEHNSKLSLLHDLADYGSSLIPAVYEKAGRSLVNGVILFHMLREVIVQVDALHVLLTNGSGPATPSVCRSLLEKTHLLLWTLKSNSVDKAEYLLVSSCRNRLKRSKIAIPGTAENVEMVKLMGFGPDDAELIRSSIHDANWCQELLSLPRFAGISKNFETHLAGGKKNPHEEKWPVVYCKSTQDKICSGSARSIAVYLSKLEEYIVYYSEYSESTHGSSLFESLTLSDIRFRVNNIRGMEEFDGVWHLAVNSAIESFQAVIKHFCPDEEQAFAEKYLSDWLERIEA